MSDASLSIERNTMLEQERQTVEPQYFDTEILYKEELARFRSERAKASKGGLGVIEKIAIGAIRYRRPAISQEPRIPEFSILDQLRKLRDPRENRFEYIEPLKKKLLLNDINIIKKDYLMDKANNKLFKDKFTYPIIPFDKYNSKKTPLSDDVLRGLPAGAQEVKERLRKIDLLSKALEGRVDLRELAQIVENNDKVEFIACALEEGLLARDVGGIPLVQALTTMESVGAIKPLLVLYHSGITFDQPLRSDVFWLLSGQKAYLSRLQAIIATPSIQAFVGDTDRQEFVGLLSHMMGSKVPHTILKNGFDDLYARRYDAVYLMRLIYGEQKGDSISSQIKPDLGVVTAVLKQPQLVKTFTDNEFIGFLDDVKSKFGYIPKPADFYSTRGQSQLVVIYQNPTLREALLNESTPELLRALKQFGYTFRLEDINQLSQILQSSNGERLLQVLNTFRDSFKFTFRLELLPQLARLAESPDILRKLDEARSSIQDTDFHNENNLKLFLMLDAEAGLYHRAHDLFRDDYFHNIRDAQKRIANFTRSMYNGEFPDAVVARMFAVSNRATDLDRLALKITINNETAKVANQEGWWDPVLRASTYQEVNEALTGLMMKLTVPAIYKGLEGDELVRKQNELSELAVRDPEFEAIFEIACRSVGIYSQKYPQRGVQFNTLLDGIKNAIELNLERNPRQYAQKRFEVSAKQFEKLFSDLPSEVRNEVMQMWQDMSARRRLRVSGSMITPEEATLSRLNIVRDTVRVDLATHLPALFMAKLDALREETGQEGTSPISVEQRAIFEQYLLTPEGELRQDLPNVYRSLESFIRQAQKALKNAELPKEEKARLGRSLGTYQAVSDTVKAIYRLHTISEARYKARKDYIVDVDAEIKALTSGLKRLRMVDPEKRSQDVNIRALEDEVLNDINNLKNTMAEENIAGQTLFETETTISFKHMAEAPDLTQSCQRLTEVTGQNHAAYSRLLDGINEMIDIFETRNGQRVRLARSFVELSKLRISGEKQSRPVILLDREYVNPQYQNFSVQFSQEMIGHLLDRITNAPHVSLLFSSSRFGINRETQELLQERGYRVRQVNGDYFINQSDAVPLVKYYDSLSGVTDVSRPHYSPIRGFCLVEKI